MSDLSSINMAELPAPTMLAEQDFDSLYAETLEFFKNAYPNYSAVLASDPVTGILRVLTYLRMMVVQEVNDISLQNMVAYATGNNLDQLGANVAVSRKTNEADDDFRVRIPMALETTTTAGSREMYIAHALSIDGVEDAGCVVPTLGSPEVVIPILATPTDNNPLGTPDQALLDSVRSLLSAEDVRPVNDIVTVQAAKRVEYAIEATVYFYSGPSAESVLSTGKADLEKYVESLRKIGKNIPVGGISSKLWLSGVSNVVITSPSADVDIDDYSVSYCTGITVTNGGTGE